MYDFPSAVSITDNKQSPDRSIHINALAILRTLSENKRKNDEKGCTESVETVPKSKMMPNDMKKRIADGLKFVGRAMPAGLVIPFVDFVHRQRADGEPA